jgi:hypothetical protein
MLSSFHRFDQVAGVNFHLDGEHAPTINACMVSVARKQLNFIGKWEQLPSVAALKIKLSENTIIGINFTGRGVVTKQLDTNVVVDQQFFARIFPNAVLADFYVQQFVSGGGSYLTVVRRVEADRWLDQLRKEKLIPLMVSLGPFPVQQILNQLNVYEQKLNFDGHQVEWNEQQHWLSYQYVNGVHSAFPIKADNEVLKESALLPYAAAFQLLMADRIPPICAEISALGEQLRMVTGMRKLKVEFIATGLITFILLLANFLILNYLRDDNVKLADRLSSGARHTADVQSLQERIVQKENVLKDVGWEGYLNKSVYVNQLTQMLPQEMTLEELSIDPLDQAATRMTKLLTFEKRSMRIRGSSPTILSVNEWMGRLRTFKWVKDIQMENYTFEKESNSGLFTILISY